MCITSTGTDISSIFNEPKAMNSRISAGEDTLFFTAKNTSRDDIERRKEHGAVGLTLTVVFCQRYAVCFRCY